MKVLMNLFFLSKIGGVFTFHNNLKKGFEKIGAKVIDNYISANKKNINEEHYKKKYNVSHVCGFYTNEMLVKYKTIIEEFDPDIILFTYPCPTITSKFKEEKWQELYRLSEFRCIPVFHEPIDHIGWLKDVKQYIPVCLAVQEKGVRGKNNIKELNDKKCYIIDHPESTENADLYSDIKQKYSISTHHMKPWKHVDLIVRSIPNFNYPIKMTGIETEYYYMSGSLEKRKETYKDENGEWIWDKAINTGKLKYLGVITREEVDYLFKGACCSIDMSTGEYGTKIKRQESEIGNSMLAKYLKINAPDPYRSLNYGVFSECCKFGVIPIMRYEWSRIKTLELFEEETNQKCAIWLKEFNLVNNIHKSVNNVIDKFDTEEMINIRKNNLQLLKTKLEDKIIAKNIIKIHKENCL